MATRKFNNIEYLIPGFDTAIQMLRPGCDYDFNHNQRKFEFYKDPEGRPEPTWEELEEEVIREVKVYNYYLYERTREEQYPTIKEQLDMLYHDIKDGKLNNGTWIKRIETVKENNPKPTYPKPV